MIQDRLRLYARLVNGNVVIESVSNGNQPIADGFIKYLPSNVDVNDVDDYVNVIRNEVGRKWRHQ